MGCAGDKNAEVKEVTIKKENINSNAKENMDKAKQEAKNDYVSLKKDNEEVGVKAVGGEEYVVEKNKEEAVGEKHFDEVGIESGDRKTVEKDKELGDNKDIAVLERDYEVVGIEAAEGEECFGKV